MEREEERQREQEQEEPGEKVGILYNEVKVVYMGRSKGTTWSHSYREPKSHPQQIYSLKVQKVHS